VHQRLDIGQLFVKRERERERKMHSHCSTLREEKPITEGGDSERTIDVKTCLHWLVDL